MVEGSGTGSARYIAEIPFAVSARNVICPESFSPWVEKANPPVTGEPNRMSPDAMTLSATRSGPVNIPNWDAVKPKKATSPDTAQVCHFEDNGQDSWEPNGDATATLMGATFGGTNFVGTDSICVVQ